MSVTESHGAHAFATKREAAEILRVTPRTISRYVQAGLLTPSYTPSGHARFSRAAVEALLTPPSPAAVADPPGDSSGASSVSPPAA